MAKEIKNKYREAFEKLGYFELDLEQWEAIRNPYTFQRNPTVFNLLEKTLVTELAIINEAIEKALKYDQLQKKETDQSSEPEINETNGHKVNERCICGSDQVYEFDRFMFDDHEESYLDKDGNLCQKSSGGIASYKCLKCKQTWNTKLKPQVVVLKKAEPKKKVRPR